MLFLTPRNDICKNKEGKIVFITAFEGGPLHPIVGGADVTRTPSQLTSMVKRT